MNNNFMKIIVGLGNPGKKYENTRHNVGFMAVDAMANEKWKFNKKFNAEISNSENAILIKPQTFMNNSGRSVQAIMSFYKLLPKKLGVMKIKNSDLSDVLTVIHDDLDIELGKYKISSDSRSAGHNGVQSIINHLKTKKIKRIRIGIKTESTQNIPTEKFVLQKFNKEEMEIINKLLSVILKNF
ncbi:MAG: aminoacyl-tRNA hydrolase [Candidatus Falkowbacteria bacterium]